MILDYFFKRHYEILHDLMIIPFLRVEVISRFGGGLLSLNKLQTPLRSGELALAIMALLTPGGRLRLAKTGLFPPVFYLVSCYLSFGSSFSDLEIPASGFFQSHTHSLGCKQTCNSLSSSLPGSGR
jgi:hypothetical protein